MINHADGLYDANKVLDHLKTLTPEDVDLDGDSPGNIWRSIRGFEV